MQPYRLTEDLWLNICGLVIPTSPSSHSVPISPSISSVQNETQG